jgi:hypothetical protein
MKNFTFTTVLFVLVVCGALRSAPVRAIGLDEVTLTDLSSSERSAVVDRGGLENYSDHMFGKFFVQTGDKNYPKIFLVAEGELIKSFPKKSYWLFTKVYLPRIIKPGNKVLVLTSNQVTSGRPIFQKQRHVVLSKDQYDSVESYLSQNSNNVPDRLIEDLDSYDPSDEMFETKKVPEADQLVQTYESFRKKGGQHMSDDYEDESTERFFVGKREVHLADIKREEDKKLLDSIAKNYVDKTNDQKFGLANGIYKEQKKTPGEPELNEKITVTSVYDDMKEEKKLRETIDPKAVAKIKRDGPNWSADMDDVTLRRYFIRTGLEHEARRRELALNELEGNEIMFHYSGSAINHTTSSDQNYQNLGYSIGLGYDLHLSRTSQDLKQWSLQFILEKGVSDYDIGGQNARGEEGYYGAYLNYYFVNNPLTLNSFIFLGGLGIKAGSVSMSNAELSKEYSYQVLTLPSFQIMTKYRFRSGDLTEDTANVGASLNAGMVVDMKRMSVIDNLADDINGKISLTDVRYLVGMSVYF